MLAFLSNCSLSICVSAEECVKHQQQDLQWWIGNWVWWIFALESSLISWFWNCTECKSQTLIKYLSKLTSWILFFQLRFIWGICKNVKTYCSTIHQNGLTSAVQTARVQAFENIIPICTASFVPYQSSEWMRMFIFCEPDINCHNQIFPSPQMITDHEGEQLE